MKASVALHYMSSESVSVGALAVALAGLGGVGSADTLLDELANSPSVTVTPLGR